MYTVGFVDNSFDLLPDYQTRLRRYEIELLYPKEGKSQEQIEQWILQNDIRCLMVDHKLRPDFDFAGTDLVAYINSALPDLPCMILTAYRQESLNEKLVVQNMIESRESLEPSDLTAFANKLKQAVDVFSKRLELRENEYRSLLEKKQKGMIVAQQEERLEYLYRLLRSYGEIDELPTELLRPEMEDKVDSLIGKLNNLLADITSEKEDR